MTGGPLRLLIDACLTPTIPSHLTAAFGEAVDAVHVDRVLPIGTPDAAVLDRATAERRLVVTANGTDFTALLRSRPDHRLPGQRGAPPAVRARLQPGRLPAYAGAARCGGPMVADHPAREADQGRRQDWAPWPLRRVPAGRGGGAAGAVHRAILRRTDRLRGPPVPAT